MSVAMLSARDISEPPSLMLFLWQNEGLFFLTKLALFLGLFRMSFTNSHADLNRTCLAFLVLRVGRS